MSKHLPKHNSHGDNAAISANLAISEVFDSENCGNSTFPSHLIFDCRDTKSVPVELLYVDYTRERKPSRRVEGFRPPVLSDIMDVGEAAEFLRIEKSTIYAWVHRRLIPFRKHGRRLAFDRKDLEAWSEKNAVSERGS